MSVIISVFYPLWYRSYRLRIKEIIETDVNAAKTLLDQTVIEHNTINDPEEDHKLKHAQLHSEHAALEENQKQATINALNED